jgi:hypothetical protein
MSVQIQQEKHMSTRNQVRRRELGKQVIRNTKTKKLLQCNTPINFVTELISSQFP